MTEKGILVQLNELKLPAVPLRRDSTVRTLRFLFKIVLWGATHRTLPVIGNIFKFCTGGHAVVRVSLGRIINITAYCAYILIHPFTLLSDYEL